MQIKLRSKFVFAISLLLIIIFTLAAFLLINEKKQEMAEDIYLNSISFAKLTAPRIAFDQELYLDNNSFLYFNQKIKEYFVQNRDLSKIQVISYDGKILYDSDIDLLEKYQGNIRLLDATLLPLIRSENIALKTVDDKIYFVDPSKDANKIFDQYGVEIAEEQDEIDLISFIILPGNERYSILYAISYENFYLRIVEMTNRIIYLAIFGVMLGILLAGVLAAKMTKPIKELVDSAGVIAKGDFSSRVRLQTNDELGFLGASFNSMARDLEKSVAAKIYQQRVVRELELAAEIQKELIPEMIPKTQDLDIAANIWPAGEIGGDMYDFIDVIENRLIFYLGDVTGHGIPAGIVSSIASSLFYAYANTGDLKKMMVEVNRVFHKKTLPNIFMTLCLMDWNTLTKEFSYVNAGHERLIHFQAAQKKVVLAPAGGIAIGMIADIKNIVKLEKLNFQPGDFIISYSDGLPEAWRNQKEIFGMDRFTAFVEQTVQSYPQITALELQNAILNNLKDFCNGYEQMDDVTIIVVKRR